MMIRKLSAEESSELLRRGRVGRLGCISDDAPYVVPVNYVFNDDALYVHSLPGRKIYALRENPRACLQVDESVDDMNWRSVIAFGRYEEIRDDGERARALKLLLSRFERLTPVETLMADDAQAPAPVVFRIRVESVTGLCEE